jgi:hypothetical protein
MDSPALAADSGPNVDSMQGCVGTAASAPPASNPKVDIVWIVDASASMLDEQLKIGANLSQFAESIAQKNVDAHIVMLTTTAALPVVCPAVPPDPLAGSPLAGDPRYRFVDTRVDSVNSLDVAVSSFPAYADFLRREAATHFVVVSDDESRYKLLATPAERTTAFLADMEQLLGKTFTLHTISSDGPTACTDPMCMPDANSGICSLIMLGCGAAAPGATYYSLARATAGLSASICLSDWRSIFEPLSAAVVESAPLPCSFKIPPPPTGESLDPTKVNVGYLAPARTDELIFPKVQDQAACAGAAGWHYDRTDQPSEVLLCPETCTQVAVGGTINLAFGCETILVL